MIARLITMSAASVLGIAANLAVIPASRAEPGVFDDRIVFGQSTVLEGPAAALGVGMREGILAAFNEANTAGGINGRRLELVSRDDGYEPSRAIENTNRLIKEDQVFALIGEVGTPTSKAAQPIATEARVPFIGPFTGAGFLRDPSLGNVINVRASYDQETADAFERVRGRCTVRAAGRVPLKGKGELEVYECNSPRREPDTEPSLAGNFKPTGAADDRAKQD